ncbi:isochorismate synthase MenF [Pseudomonas sp. 5P_3.1_Bac2]|uniref:isochorismate synthase n=1 Tax=Pseudomonas sp. 5P_3.1_Bac2 TaxID=2971617 RepID=UPI0021C8DECE|nr:isochorismate synthase MenF [Pseudomonas sp. 5P_3.1_Bac2]MCU1717157.1 isochorismate synthase MenF [Pseudomonas sp. 5P_3.1_Bac2]
MRTGTLPSTPRDAAQPIDKYRSFSFTSGDRELITQGILERLDTPAAGGFDPQSGLQQQLKIAFENARQKGHKNPVVVGAIPFDPSQSSALFIPEHSEWLERASSTPDSLQGTQPPLISQRNIPEESGFKRSVKHAIVNFQHSDVRKAVLSVQRELEFAQDVDLRLMQNTLRVQNPHGYHFCVPLADGATLIGVSPELLIRKRGRHFISNPLAGSAKRMADPQADQLSAQNLANSAKDHYEHSFVTEDIAAQLAGLCQTLEVPAQPSLLSTAALWHLSSKIEGQLLDEQTNALQLACRLHPTPAVCGYPTELARRLIRFVEPFERGLFSGMVGWCDAEGNGEWVVTIRCGLVKRNQVRLFAGAGIVEASVADAEWAEVQTKLGTMLRGCGLSQ